MNCVQLNCKHYRGAKCAAQVRLPVIDGSVLLDKPYTQGEHSRVCCVMCGVDPPPKDEVVDNEDLLFAKPECAEKKSFVEVTQEMKMKTEELSFFPGNRSKLPSTIWLEVKSFFNEKYSGNWYGLQEHQVVEMVRKCRSKLGHGNSISTLENVMDYSKMPSKDRPFLHHSMCSPHPEKCDVMMRLMIFANPALLGHLNGVVDLFIDATFSCVPAPFYQCLIIMVFDHSTSHYLPVIYALMMHKVQELYWQVFNQVFLMTKWKMQVRTYTSDFELAMMNMLELLFGKNAGGGKHVGCFFHLKQAWRKYLVEMCGLGQSSLLGPLMAVGGLDLLCVIPRHEIESVGIPFLRLTLEGTATKSEKSSMDKFYAYFRKQWLRISKNWNIREEHGHFLQMVNRTNNGLESYNRRFNSIFPKTPSLLEFNESVKNESIRQEAILNDIRDGKRREKVRPAVWIPDIPVCYNEFKTEQKVTEDLGWNVATDLGADLSDTDCDIPTKSNIKKATKAMKPPTKRPAAEQPTKRPAKRPATEPPTKRYELPKKRPAAEPHTKRYEPPTKRPAADPPTKRAAAEPPTKRPAAEPPTKRPAAEPLGEISDNVSGRPKRKTKRPKKSLP